MVGYELSSPGGYSSGRGLPDERSKLIIFLVTGNANRYVNSSSGLCSCACDGRIAPYEERERFSNRSDCYWTNEDRSGENTNITLNTSSRCFGLIRCAVRWKKGLKLLDGWARHEKSGGVFETNAHRSTAGYEIVPLNTCIRGNSRDGGDTSE